MNPNIIKIIDMIFGHKTVFSHPQFESVPDQNALLDMLVIPVWVTAETYFLWGKKLTIKT